MDRERDSGRDMLGVSGAFAGSGIDAELFDGIVAVLKRLDFSGDVVFGLSGGNNMFPRPK